MADDDVELELTPGLAAALEGVSRWTPEEATKYVDELPEHPLFMTRSPTLADERDNAYVAALTHMAYDGDDGDTPESMAREAKERGNVAFAKGADFFGHAIKHYNDAIDHASRAMTRASRREMRELSSVVYSNLAAVYLARRRYKTALDSCTKALTLNPSNAKALYRAARACMLVGRATSAREFATLGEALGGTGADAFVALRQEAEAAIRVQEQHAAAARAEAAAVMSSLSRVRAAAASRRLRVGAPMLRDMRRTRALPYVDADGLMHWPMLLLYPDVGHSDYLEDVAEDASIEAIVDSVGVCEGSRGGRGPPWDTHGDFQPDRVDVFYHACPPSLALPNSADWWRDAEPSFPRSSGVDGRLGARGMTGESTAPPEPDAAAAAAAERAWVRVPRAAPLLFVLSQPDFVLRDIPVLLLVSRRARRTGDDRADGVTVVRELHLPLELQ